MFLTEWVVHHYDVFMKLKIKIVSSDIIGTEYGLIFDPTITQIASGTDYSQVIKAFAWCDNESGFEAQMIRTLQKIAKLD